MAISILILSVVIGVLGASLLSPERGNLQKLSLAFSGAFLFGVSIFHLIPEVYHHHPTMAIGFWVIGGFILQYILDFFSKGIEHGHFHADENHNISRGLILALFLHAFLEGMPLGHHHEGYHSESLLYAIAFHKIPISAVLYLGLKNAGMSRVKILLAILGFALMAPIGFLVQKEVPFFHSYLHEIQALVLGIFFHVSTTIWFETSKNHQFNFQKLLVILIAIGIAALTAVGH